MRGGGDLFDGAHYNALLYFFFQAEDGIRDVAVTGAQTCALPISAVHVEGGVRAVRAGGPSATAGGLRPQPAAQPDRRMTEMRLGLRENLPQFTLLVVLNAFVGAMVGLERTVLPLLGEQEFGLTSKTAITSFIVSFGVTKAEIGRASCRE